MKRDWIEVDLGLVCDFKGGGTPSKSVSSYWNGDIPWASIKDVKGSYLTQTEDFITEEGLNNSASNLAFENEIILATRINPGRPIISKIKTAVNQDLKIVKPLITFSNKFLFYIFKKIEPEIIKASSGTTVLGINLTNLREIQVPVPPISEQRAIVSKIEELFSELDHSIASFKAAKAKLEIYRQAVLKKAFEGGFTSNSDNSLQGFQFIQLDQVSEAIGGFAFKSGDFSNEKGNFQVIRIGNIRPGLVRLNESPVFLDELSEKIKSKYLLVRGDVLITLTGTRKKRDYGFTAVVKDSNLLLNQRVAAIRFQSEFEPEFFLYYSWTNQFKDQFFGSETGNVGQGNVGMKSIRETLIPNCPKVIQTQIVQEIESRLSVADKLAETIEINLKKSEALRQSILKKAFEGKLLSEAELDACRKEADWEPAEKLLERINLETKSKK